MVVYMGILEILPGKREEYIQEIQKLHLFDLFKSHAGNVFYTIGSSVEDPDTVIVCDGWEDQDSFERHDHSEDVVGKWRPLYEKYVVRETSRLLKTLPD